jgi:hypothetical protein
MANTQAVADTATQHYVLEIRLDDGETLHANMGDDLESARTRLAAIHTRFGSDAFVLLGEDTVVRSGDIRHVQLHEREPSGRGLLGTLKARMEGDDMSTYETEHVTESRRPGGGARRPQAGGVLDEAFIGYGRRPWAETKPFFLTSEFLTLLVTAVALAIAMAVSDVFDGNRGWTLIAGVAAAYIVSRGIAKAGTRDPNPREANRY